MMFGKIRLAVHLEQWPASSSNLGMLVIENGGEELRVISPIITHIAYLDIKSWYARKIEDIRPYEVHERHVFDVQIGCDSNLLKKGDVPNDCKKVDEGSQEHVRCSFDT